MWDEWDDNSAPSSQPQANDFPRNQRQNWRDKSQGQRKTFSNRNGFRGENRANNDNATVIKVPSRFVGRIIGKGGCKISDLQYESGAKINVTRETEGDETLIKLIGGDDEVAKAEGLIRDLTIDREPQDRPERHAAAAADQPKIEVNDMNWRQIFKECDDFQTQEWAKLPPIQKQFYTEHPEVTALTPDEVAKFREDNNNITVQRTFEKDGSKPIPNPVLTFEHAFFKFPEILGEIEKAGFTTPSPIQAQAWPILLGGEDMIGIAQTGTGKTLAFLLPALIHIDGQLTKKEERPGPAVLVMAPTRELALQIDKEVKKYEYKGISAVCLYGGGDRREQIKVVKRGVDIVIGTPGRLNDLMEVGHLNVKFITYVVLDEADRMLDMGFEPQIRKIMYSVRPNRQTVMTSATWPLGIRRLAQSYMEDPIQVYVGSLDLAAVETVSQIIEVMPNDDEAKFSAFMNFALNLDPAEKVIVFCGKKARADELSSELVLHGLHCQTIHGDREQSDREQALLDIADGTVQILIATDVASRGLHIDDITHVINYDFPRNIEEYVHRVGRTGRAGKAGKSISYVTRDDWSQAKDLIAILEKGQQYVPEEIYKMAERYSVWKEKKDAQRPSRGGGRRYQY